MCLFSLMRLGTFTTVLVDKLKSGGKKKKNEIIVEKKCERVFSLLKVRVSRKEYCINILEIFLPKNKRNVYVFFPR